MGHRSVSISSSSIGRGLEGASQVRVTHDAPTCQRPHAQVRNVGAQVMQKAALQLLRVPPSQVIVGDLNEHALRALRSSAVLATAIATWLVRFILFAYLRLLSVSCINLTILFEDRRLTSIVRAIQSEMLHSDRLHSNIRLN